MCNHSRDPNQNYADLKEIKFRIKPAALTFVVMAAGEMNTFLSDTFKCQSLYCFIAIRSTAWVGETGD